MRKVQLWYSKAQADDGLVWYPEHGYPTSRGYGIGVRLDTGERVYFTQTNEYGIAVAPAGQTVRQEALQLPYKGMSYLGEFNGEHQPRLVIVMNTDGTTPTHSIGPRGNLTRDEARLLIDTCERFNIQTHVVGNLDAVRPAPFRTDPGLSGWPYPQRRFA